MKQMDHGAYAKKVRKLSESELRFIIKDCQEALAALPDSPNAGYYSDEICYCSSELFRRSKKASK